MPANNPQPTRGEKFSSTLRRHELETLMLVAFRKFPEAEQRKILGLVENWTASRTAKN